MTKHCQDHPKSRTLVRAFPAMKGFTLIELLITLSIIALIMSIALPRYIGGLARADEAVLREDLYLMRDAIDKFFSDNGQYPATLNDLVSKRYLRSIPADPLTQSATAWIIVPPTDPKMGAVYDIRSGAPGVGRNGKPYSEW